MMHNGAGAFLSDKSIAGKHTGDRGVTVRAIAERTYGRPAAPEKIYMCADSAQMGNNMKKYIYFTMLSLYLFVALFPLRVRAASGDGLRLDGEGTVTVVSQHAAKEGISSLCFSLSVESANAAGVEFQFGESKAKILDYRYDQATGNIKIYLAGTEALFAEGTDALTVGRIKVLDGSGNEVAATVSAVENSLQYVYGTELKTMQEVELPGAVQIGPAAVQPPPSQPDNPSMPQNPPAPQAPAATQAPAVIPPQLPVTQPTAAPCHREAQAHGGSRRRCSG